MTNRAGMTTLEYSLLALAILLALFAMQGTLRRAISARWKESADAIGFGMQYEDSAGGTTITQN